MSSECAQFSLSSHDKKEEEQTNDSNNNNNDDSVSNKNIVKVSDSYGKGMEDTEDTASTVHDDNNNDNTVSSSPDNSTCSNTQVSDYEAQIQNDIWPLDCIKCNTLLGNLSNFNLHMNDHWSDDKCCPVCGLLINSKRFNFKQHLKIHTGEKPYVTHFPSVLFADSKCFR